MQYVDEVKEYGFKKLIAWQVADEFAWNIYQLTDKFPKDEIYGITSQIRRAVLSIVLNITEGYSRFNKKEFRNFLRISLGSLAEVDYLIRFSFKRKYISETDFISLINLRERCGQLLWKLMISQK